MNLKTDSEERCKILYELQNDATKSLAKQIKPFIEDQTNNRISYVLCTAL